MRHTVVVFLILVVIGACVYGDTANALTQPPITISPLSDHLYIITCTGGEEFGLPPYGTNLVASVGADGILLIDAGFASTGGALADTLKTLGDGRVGLVINTHHHGDHTFGNQFLSGEAVTMAHRNAVDRLSGKYFHLKELPGPNRPAVGFDDSLVIHFNDETIHVVHVPSCHSSGDVYVYFVNSAVVAAGDLFFSDEIPYIDLRAGGSVERYIGQVKAFIDEFPDEVVFVASHGRQYSKDDLRKYVGMLTTTVGLVRSAAAEGRTDDDMIQDGLLAGWEEWNGRFATTSLEAWIRTVYAEMSGPADAKTSVCEPLTEVLARGSVEQAAVKYYELKSSQPDAWDFGEPQLNMLGYQLLYRDRLDDALEIFRLNVEAFPASSNVYDSYGEALLLAGDTAQSVANYERSLELNPENTNAVEVLSGLRQAR